MELTIETLGNVKKCGYIEVCCPKEYGVLGLLFICIKYQFL